MPSHFLLEKLINHSTHHLGSRGESRGAGGPVQDGVKGDIRPEGKKLGLESLGKTALSVEHVVQEDFITGESKIIKV